MTARGIRQVSDGNRFAFLLLVRLNACELEIDLFCKGMRILEDTSASRFRGPSRMRAGLGSGLEVVIPVASGVKNEIWVNVPVVEPFASRSPYVLVSDNQAAHAIVDERTGVSYPVRVPPPPSWYASLTSNDIPMRSVGILQGTYLAIYVNPVCAFWSASPRLNCRFCTTGQNVGVNEASVKQLSDVVETCWAAKEESGITFVHLNGGFQGSHGLEMVKPFVKAIKEEVGLLVGVQLTPDRDLSRYDELVEMGVDHFSFCVELMDEAWFARICPGKARVHGQRQYFSAMEHCVNLLPRGAVSGEVIAGIEPIENTIAAIDRITELGAFPTVCIFRPTVGSDMEFWPPPSYEDMRRVMAHVYDACRAHWLPIGAAPNIEVSLVVNPDDAALLAERTLGVQAYELYRRVARLAARPLFNRRMRAC